MSEQYFLRAEDVQEVLGCSHSHAYKVIRDLNTEIKALGYMTMTGRVEKSYLMKRYGLDGGIHAGIEDHASACQ